MKGYQPTPFALRMEPELKEWLAAKAKENARSLNSEIVHRLRTTKEREVQHAQQAA